MNDKIQVFSHPQFGKVGTIQTEDGKVLFKATDVAKALGYVETAKAVRTHCKGVSVLDTPLKINMVQSLCNQQGTFRKRTYTVL